MAAMSLKTTEDGTTVDSAMVDKESQPAYHVRIDENSEQVCVSEVVSQSAAAAEEE